MGVDLSDSAQKGLIDRLYWARFAYRIRAVGLDPKDCLQEVYRGFLARNGGTRPFDPTVSSLSNYAFIVIRSVTLNFLDAARRSEVRNGLPGASKDAALVERSESRAW